MSPTGTSRRRFAFWVGFGLFSLAERLGVSALDDLAAATMSLSENDETAEHWSVVQNASWRWYERENFVDGRWKTTGVTTPINCDTGERYIGQSGYVDEKHVPNVILSAVDRKRLGRRLVDVDSWQERHVSRKPAIAESNGSGADPETIPVEFGDRSRSDAGRSNDDRRSRHGRPPSKWLRSLTADEIRIWLAKVEIQDAHVSGMTFWTHLTRDHSFDPDRIEGLSELELAELHGAAHEGF